MNEIDLKQLQKEKPLKVAYSSYMIFENCRIERYTDEDNNYDETIYEMVVLDGKKKKHICITGEAREIVKEMFKRWENERNY